MFSKAMALAAQYTRPVIVTKRLKNGEVQSGIATFVMVNDSGWIITAAHVLQDVVTIQEHAKEQAQYQKDVAEINANDKFTKGKKKHELGLLKFDPNWITHQSLWWGIDGISFDQAHIDLGADLAITQLKGPFNKLDVKTFPTFGDPATNLAQGKSLCRLGYPFHDIKAIFNTSTNSFTIPGLPHLAMFPNDGILTRKIIAIDDQSKRQIRYLETSSAGLRGQSGGPIFDSEGVVWAVQSKTTHLPLGFSPTIEVNGKKIVEHQFMHCGWGIDISHICEMFGKFNVSYQSQKTNP